MKQTETFIVFRDKENGRFLNEYKNNEDVLSFAAGYKKKFNQHFLSLKDILKKIKKNTTVYYKLLEQNRLKLKQNTRSQH